MSADEIVFDEVTYRQPERLRRPDRDRRFACLAVGTPGPGDLPIFLERRTADAIERHALSDVSVELGGILLGRECVDEEMGRPFVWISEALEARHFENTQASFTYTHDSWEEITRRRDERHPDLQIVGWYHTHPDFGIFLSGHDLFIHQNFFGQPLQVAFVVDPIRQTRGFFHWRDGALPQVDGYTLVAPRGERLALARTVNDLEGFAEADDRSGSLTLSPRLEAELMAMLNRPRAAVAASTDRGSSAAVFSLLGMVLGALGVALAFWIATLTGQMRTQSEALEDLRSQLAEAERSRAGGEAVARVRAKEQALDALLRHVELGSDPETFVEQYTELSRERDEALADAAVFDEIRDQLLVKNARIRNLENVLEDRTEERDRYQDEARRVPDLLEANAGLAERAAKVSELEDRLALVGEIEDGTFAQKYAIAKYGALAGWGVAVLLGLGMVVVVARTPPGGAGEAVEGPSPDGPGDTPDVSISGVDPDRSHRID